MTTIAIECKDVVKRYGPATVLDRVDWTVRHGQVAGLIGASGAGKTTLLRIIAGLSSSTSGTIALTGGAQGVRPRIGMAFQNLALWPHLTARRHLECVLSAWPRRQRRSRAEAVLDEAGLPRDCWERRPAQLSGGEAQRLALARALAPRPEILLLDEPLAHLDAERKGELLRLIGQLPDANSVTVVYVTHVWGEAAAICAQIAMMDAGRIKQSGAPDQLFWAPADRKMALLSGPLIDLPLDWLDAGAIAFGDAEPSALSVVPIEAGRIGVRPQQLRLTGSLEANRWQVLTCRPHGAGWTVGLANGNYVLELPAALPPVTSDVGIELLARGMKCVSQLSTFFK
ncbi:MAG TPA: ABC transporter ATP-binding protein [Thermomicrobiales bacterium]|nr:ABC transporter ATP-binding protein [Thermomicrobiales bacterium]